MPDLKTELARMAAEPPHVADYSRRRFIGNAARWGLTAATAAAMTRHLAMSALAATPELPAIKDFPAALKGSGVVRVCSYGGAFQAAQREAYFKPFEELSGIKVVESQGPDISKVKAMVDTGNVEYDVGEFDRASIINLERKGEYWEPIDYSLFDTDNIDPAFRYKYSVDMLPYGQIFGYRTDAFKGDAPTGVADLWDTKRFPGSRSLQAGSGGLAPDLEVAIMATGVPKEKVYPINIDTAFASLGKIKPDVDKWWTAGAIPAQLLNDNEVVMATAWNGRIYAIQQTGAKVAPVWKDGPAAHRRLGDPERRGEQGQRAEVLRLHHHGGAAGADFLFDPVWLCEQQVGGTDPGGPPAATADGARHAQGFADLQHAMVGG